MAGRNSQHLFILHRTIPVISVVGYARKKTACRKCGGAMQTRKTTAARILKQSEIEEILSRPDQKTQSGIRDLAILELLAGAGLKVQEVLALRPEDLDLQISCVLLTRDGAQDDEKVRMVPFGKRTRKALFNYLYLIRGSLTGPDDLLFPGRDGKMLSRQAVWKIVKKYAAAAGIQSPVSPEDLRTALAVSLLNQGLEPEGVQEILGIRAAAMRKYLRK